VIPSIVGPAIAVGLAAWGAIGTIRDRRTDSRIGNCK
jgi:hypothetical protein